MLRSTTLAHLVDRARKVPLEAFVATHAPFLIVLDASPGGAADPTASTTKNRAVERATSARVRPPPDALVYELAKAGSDPISVGRSAESDVSLVHHSVSKQHAWIVRGPPGTAWRICDAGSRNGTYVGGAAVPAPKGAFLADDVQVGLGEVRCRFVTAAAMHALAAKARAPKSPPPA